MLIADINAPEAEAAAARARECGVEAIGTLCDVGDGQSWIDLRDLALATFGRVDVVMNNAGVILSGLPQEIPLPEWERVFNVNAMSVVRSIQVFVPLLLGQGAGHIINTASIDGLITYSFDRIPYAASKAAIVQISEGLALYLRPHGVGVTCLCPGPVNTNILQSIRAWSGSLDLRGAGREFRLIEPHEVGAMVVEAVRNNSFFLPTDVALVPKLISRARDWDNFLDEEMQNPHIIMKAQEGH